MMAALLDAHPNMMFSQQANALRALNRGFGKTALQGMILGKSNAFADGGARGLGHDIHSTYSYAVQNQWQGRHERVLVLGDKQAPATTGWLSGNHSLLSRLGKTMGTSVRLFHMIRNPFANISGIYRLKSKRGMTPSLSDAIEYYFQMANGVNALKQEFDEIFLDVFLEELIDRPKKGFAEACSFLGVPSSDEYLEACASVVFNRPRTVTEDIQWTAESVETVKQQMAKIPFLQRYEVPTSLMAK